MAINLTTTKQAAIDNGAKICVYGGAGVGKTTLCGTATNNVIISAEAGLMPLRDRNIPVIEVSNLEDVKDAYRFIVESEEGKQFDWVSLDSISEIAEACLSAQKKASNDGRRAYGDMNDIMADLIRGFRDIPEKNVYFSCKMREDSNAPTFHPMLPGGSLSQQMPYWFDEVLCLRAEPDDEGALQRWLQTDKCLNHPDVKDRSGRLEMWEKPDLDAIATKIFEGYDHGEAIAEDIEQLEAAESAA